MNLSRRALLRLATATGATVVLPRVGRAVRSLNHVNPAFVLTGGAATDGVLVNSTLSPGDAYAYVDLAVSRSSQMTDPTLVGVQRADGDAIVRHIVRGKDPDTTYYARLVSEGTMVGETVRFKTLMTGSASWTRKIAVVSCQGNAADHFSTQLAWADILSWGADDVWHLGDWGYWGQLIAAKDSYKKDLYHYLRTMRHFETMRRAIQSADLNVLTISDHELTIGGDPDGGILNSPESIRELVAFQKLMPVRLYGDTRNPRRGRYYWFDMGAQVRVIVTDFRSPDRSNNWDEDGPSKTMFGASQLAWLLASLDATKVNIIANETSWLADADQKGRAKDKPWYYNYEQQIIADHITQGGYKVVWVGGDRHYVGYLSGSGTPRNSLGGFPCYISSGMAKESLDLQRGELMTWQFGANHTKPARPVCGYMQVTMSYNASSHVFSFAGQGRAVLDTTQHVSEWTMEDIPGGTAQDSWTL